MPARYSKALLHFIAMGEPDSVVVRWPQFSADESAVLLDAYGGAGLVVLHGDHGLGGPCRKIDLLFRREDRLLATDHRFENRLNSAL